MYVNGWRVNEEGERARLVDEKDNKEHFKFDKKTEEKYEGIVPMIKHGD